MEPGIELGGRPAAGSAPADANAIARAKMRLLFMIVPPCLQPTGCRPPRLVGFCRTAKLRTGSCVNAKRNVRLSVDLPPCLQRKKDCRQDEKACKIERRIDADVGEGESGHERARQPRKCAGRVVEAEILSLMLGICMARDQ